MIARALATTACLGLAACGAADPVGSYATDGARHARSVREAAPPAFVGKLPAGTEVSWRIDLEIAADHTFAMTLRPPAEGRRRTGTWSQDGDTVTLQSTTGDMPAQQATLRGDELHLQVAPGAPRIVLFRRGA